MQSAFFIGLILIFESNPAMAIVTLYALLNLLLLKRFRARLVFFFILLLLPALISLFLTGLWHLDPSLVVDKSLVYTKIWGITIYKQALKEALFLVMRSGSISVISFAYVISINFEKLVGELMQNFKFPVILGYALLATVNAFDFMKREFLKIRIAYEMRFLKSYYSPKILIPLLVAATRYSQQASLMLESRGLNKRKNFYRKYKIASKDYLLLVIQTSLVVFLIKLIV